MKDKNKENLVKENKGINRKLVLWACDNENNISANYSNFLTTIAAIFLGLSPLALNKITTDEIIWIKICLSLSIIFILLSLLFGGVYIFLKRLFFSRWVNNYSEIFNKWNECSKNNDNDIEKAFECEKCIYSSSKTVSPQWPLIVQSVFLLLGVSIIVFIVILKIH